MKFTAGPFEIEHGEKETSICLPRGCAIARVYGSLEARQADAGLFAEAHAMAGLLRRIVGCWPNHHLSPDFVRDGYALLERIDGANEGKAKP